MKKESFQLLMIYIFSFIFVTPGFPYQVQILYPIYNYPNHWDTSSYIWDDVAAAAQLAPITAIINPDSGPGRNGPNEDYQRGLRTLQAAGVRMIGYVSTQYGSRDIEKVKQDIKSYNDLFSPNDYFVSGIFLDEVAAEVFRGKCDYFHYYEELYNYIKSYSDTPNLDIVILNHGTHTNESYTQIADVNVIFEGSSHAWNNYNLAPYVANHPSEQFGMLVYSEPNKGEMKANIDLAIERNIQYVFITHDTLPNPWDILPSYWPEEADYVYEKNTAPPPPWATDPEVTISALGSQVLESSRSIAAFRIHRKGEWSRPLLVSYSVRGSATFGSDFRCRLVPVRIPAYSTSADITLRIKNDRNFEGDETIEATLIQALEYTVGSPGSATFTIIDDDEQPPAIVTVEATSPVSSETGPEHGHFTISRTGGTDKVLLVRCTVSGTADNGSDYLRLRRFTIPAGQSALVVTVTPKDDSSAESDETVTITILPHRSYQVGVASSATVSISDND